MRIAKLLCLLTFFYSTNLIGQDSVWTAKTTGRLPYLLYGIGEDRLGGAKITYLDSNVLLRITDSFQSNYKVQLSLHHHAYIPKEDVVLLQKQVNKISSHNTNLSGNIKAYGDSSFDVLTLYTGSPLPYKSMQVINPSRIAIDVFGLASNTNWIIQLRTVKEIKNVWYEQTEDDVMRVWIDLQHAQHWGYHIAYDSTGKRLVVQVKRQPATDIKKLRIVIDAGHGGDNSGASGLTSHVLEKEYTLKIAKLLEQTLRKAGVKNVLLTRTRDTTLSIPDRMDIARAFHPDLLLSIHLNSADIDTVRGTSTYYRYIGFRPLSVAILNQLLTLKLQEYGNVGNFNFGLNGPTDFPNALIEVAFLSNREDEKKILNPVFQKAVAQKIYLGIQNWLNSIRK